MKTLSKVGDIELPITPVNDTDLESKALNMAARLASLQSAQIDALGHELCQLVGLEAARTVIRDLARVMLLQGRRWICSRSGLLGAYGCLCAISRNGPGVLSPYACVMAGRSTFCQLLALSCYRGSLVAPATVSRAVALACPMVSYHTRQKDEPAYDVEVYLAGVFDWRLCETFCTKNAGRTKAEARQLAIKFAQDSIAKFLR